MKKYVTLNSEAVQLALFKARFFWATDGRKVFGLSSCLLFINSSMGAGRLTDGNNFAYLNKAFEDNCIAINPEDIIANPFQLDGATKPEKMITIDDQEWSENTIRAALKALKTYLPGTKGAWICPRCKTVNAPIAYSCQRFSG